MTRQRFSESIVIVLMIAACSREKPSGAAGSQPAGTPPRRAESAPLHQETSYADALQWFKTVRSFRFQLREGSTNVEGTMKRPTPGAERVAFGDWVASAGRKGVTWTKNGKPSDPPPDGMRLYQRVTVVFDPQKVEGEAQLVEPGHYRFTDANTRQVHDVWVRDGRIERMTIGEAVELTITP